VPSHTPLDGDLIFSLSTSEVALDNATDDAMLLGHAAALCLSRAIARGIYQARTVEGDTLPSWQSLYSQSAK